MKKSKKSKPKGPRYFVGVLLALCSVVLAWPAMAQDATPPPFGWSEKPIYVTYDHVGLSTCLSEIECRGASYRIVLGPIGQATLGANKFELGLFSLGAGMLSQPNDAPTTTSGQIGFVPGCTDHRGICAELTAQSVQSQTPTDDQDMKYLLTMLFRPSQGIGGGSVPVASATPVATRYLPSFAGLNALTP